MAEIKNIVDRVIETDVLVIGGGGAGANAAVAAARSGTKVTLVAKGALGRSGQYYYVECGLGNGRGERISIR